MKLHRLPLFVVAASFALNYASAQTTVATDPVGFVTINVAAGTGTAKKSSLVSIPLLEPANITGQAVGNITGVGSSSLTNSNAGWGAGQLSAAATPYLIQMTSGNANGRTFLISTSVANTATTLTISATDITAQGNLNSPSVGIQAGDSYVIRPCDTLASFFSGAILNNVIKGSAATNSDTVVLTVNGATTTYFYRTNAPAGWVNTSRFTASGNTPITPDSGMQYQRLGATPLTFTVTGSVPVAGRKLAIKNSGSTLMSQYWPVNSTVAGLGLQTIPGWLSGNSASVADTVMIQSPTGAQATFYYDGTNWRNTSRGTISNTNPVGLGSAISISKKGTAPGYTILTQGLPYSL